jgi:hypothetical protein
MSGLSRPGYDQHRCREQRPEFRLDQREFIASGKNNPHLNAFGGEDRFWLGPEGGQFSIFFKKDTPFDLDNWFTPPSLNEERWDAAMVAETRSISRKRLSWSITAAPHLTFNSSAPCVCWAMRK